MKRHKWILFFLLFSLFACNDDGSDFQVPADGLNLQFTPVAGGAMMHYTLPNNSDIFAMNVRYTDSQGQQVLKTCGYGGDSLLLDGFTRKEEVTARVSFVNQRNEESKSLEYRFTTLDSAPWAFFNDMEVHSSWNGFRIIYKSPSVVTGMAHVFYLGINPVTQKEDTILVNSFPITRGGDTLSFIVKQERKKNTVIIRTEDFQGYRVRQEIYPDIDAFPTEKFPMTAANFNDFKLSVENSTAKTGIQYLFDGELKGKERMIADANRDPLNRNGTEVYASYLAGPYAFNKPIIIDLKEQKIPAWIRLYCLYPMHAPHPVSPAELGKIWVGSYDDKLPCKMSVYGSRESSDPNSGEWVYLGNLNQDPKATTAKDRWCFLTTELYLSPKDVNDLELKDPVYVDIPFPALNNTYRYLKILVHDTFRKIKVEINYNQQEHFTLQELEVYVKKD